MKKIAILGSTGSIGTQTLEVVRANGDIQVLGISAGRNIKKLEEQAREFCPRLVAVWEEDAARELRVKLQDTDVKVVSGMEGLLELASMEQDSFQLSRSTLQEERWTWYVWVWPLLLPCVLFLLS